MLCLAWRNSLQKCINWYDFLLFQRSRHYLTNIFLLQRRKQETFLLINVCVCSVAQFCFWLCATPWASLPGSFVHGILQGRILKSIVISSSRGSSVPFPDASPVFPILAGRFFTTVPPRKPPFSYTCSLKWWFWQWVTADGVNSWQAHWS